MTATRRVLGCALVGALLSGGFAGTAYATDPPPAPGYRPGATNAGGALQVVYRRTDGRVVLRQLTDGPHPPRDLGGNLSSGPTAVSLSTATEAGLRVAGTGTNGAVYTRYGEYKPEIGPDWGPWTSLGGTAVGGPAVSCVGNGTAVFWIRGTDDALWRRTTTAPWVKVGGSIRSAPSAAGSIDSLCLSQEYVVALGADDAVWERRAGGWHRIGGRSTLAPAIVRTLTGSHVFVVGTNGALYLASRTSDGAPWSAFRKLGGTFTAAPAATTWSDVSGAGPLTAVALGANGQLYRATGDDDDPAGQWTFAPFG